jgi:hypothetical protein
MDLYFLDCISYSLYLVHPAATIIVWNDDLANEFRGT